MASPAEAILSGTVPLPAQSPRVIARTSSAPYAWQSSIGFQKQLNAATGIRSRPDALRRVPRHASIDANLRYDPVTGYNALVAPGVQPGVWTAARVHVGRPQGSDADLAA